MSNMKRFLGIILICSFLLCGFLFVGCDDVTTPEDSETETSISTTQKIIQSVADFDVNKTYGFTYTVEQTLGNQIVNSKEINVRLYRSESGAILAGKREERKKSPNTEFEGDQFVIEEETLYYSNGSCYKYVDGEMVSSDRTIAAFSDIKLSLFGIKENEMIKADLSESNKTATLKFSVPDADAAVYLGLSEGSVKNLSFSISILLENEKVFHFEMSYEQAKTKTTIKCDPYYKNQEITLPQ